MDSNLGEVICEAVDTIVSKRLEGLQYNITKFCTIIDTTNSRLGKYVVQEEALQYEAYSADTNLKVDDYVVVLIPNGDYAEQKLILHKVVRDDDFTSSSAYISPLKPMFLVLYKWYKTKTCTILNFVAIKNTKPIIIKLKQIVI